MIDWASYGQSPNQVIRQVLMVADQILESRKKSACGSVDCPSDRRHVATSGGMRRQREWSRAACADTTRHAGWGLQNHRAPVRVLSRLPLGNTEFIWAAATWRAACFLCFWPHLTPTGATPAAMWAAPN
jgi:hypothetical protein